MWRARRCRWRRSGSVKTGRSATDTGRCCWKRSWRWPATGGPAIKRPTGFAWGRRVGEDGWIVTRDTYRLPGRSTCIRWCRSFARFCKGRAEKARGSDELPGAQRRTETGAQASGERTAQTSGRRGARESADGHDRERNESLEDGGGGTAGATRSGGRTDSGVSFRSAHLVEAVGEDPRPAESENDPTQIHGVAVIRDTPVCLPDGLATRSQSTDDSATVPGEPATAVSGAGKCCASGHAEPAAGGDRGKRDRGSTGRTDPAVHPQEEILTLLGGELLSGGD